MIPQYLKRPDRSALAYRHTPPGGEEGAGLPPVMFIGGFRSDMEGTKATYLEAQCRDRGQEFVRFDYSGHGASEGKFEDGTIGLWLEDALAVLDTVWAARAPAILAGSSMGGWIALLAARVRPQAVAGVVGIAAAPDFTRTLYDSLDAGQKTALEEQGFVALPSDYSEEPYIFTRALIEDGERHCLLDQDNVLPQPLRLVQGMKDTDVPWQTAFRIKNAVSGQAEIFLVEHGDHRLSRAEDLALIDSQVRALSGL